MATPPRPVSGEFATAEWGQWVHDYVAATRERQRVSLSLASTSGVTTAGVTVGTIALPAVPYPRIVHAYLIALPNVSAPADVWILQSPDGSAYRQRVAAGSSTSVSISAAYLVGADVASEYTAKVGAVSGTVTASLTSSGASNFNSLWVVTQPLPIS